MTITRCCRSLGPSPTRLPFAVAALLAVWIVAASGCSRPLPENWLPSGQTLGEKKPLDDTHTEVRATGMAETAVDARFFAREAACAALLNLHAVDRKLAELRATGDEWRTVVEAHTEVSAEEESVASKRGGVRVDLTVVVDRRALAGDVRDLLAAHPPQTRPAVEDDGDDEVDELLPD